jgi:dTDP-4-dehydrorhamnose reductase
MKNERKLMNVIITGANGQLGCELQQIKNEKLTIHAFNSSQLNITDFEQAQAIITSIKPDFIINAAAYTAVDKAESSSDAAFAVNATGVENLANICKKNNVKLIHVSTDFIFDGSKSTPYKITDTPMPLGVYGSSKLQGENTIREILPKSSCIIRTAWVYSIYGNNFVKTMLRLMQEKDELSIVCDQVGTPTWASGLANTIWQLVLNTEADLPALLHWTDNGVTTWYDFAVSIQELAFDKGLITKNIPISAIPSSAYPTEAKRPSFSVLDKTEVEQVLGENTIHWRKQLSTMLDVLKCETSVIHQ